MSRSSAAVSSSAAVRSSDSALRPGLFGITPTRHEVVGRPPLRLGGTRVLNTTKSSYRVKVFPALLVQRLDGGYTISEDPHDLFAAQRIMSISPNRFRMGPGETRDLSLRWELLPRHARAAFLGLVVQGDPRRPDQRGVRLISRVIGLNFLRRPGGASAHGAIAALRGEQAGRGRLRFVARVRNDGQVQARPLRGRLAVRDSAGRVVARAHWRGKLVLPGAAVEFPIRLRGRLPAGGYTATASMRFGHARARRSTNFRLVRPNELPTVRFALAGIRAGARTGDPAKVHLTVANTGTARASTAVAVSLFDVSRFGAGSAPLATKRVSVGPLSPGARRTVDFDLGSAQRGSYRVLATLGDGQAEDAQMTTDFAALPSRSLIARLRTPPLALLGLALLGGIAFLVARSRRTRRRLERELAAARSAVPLGSSNGNGNGHIDLNAADPAALAMLPGIGAAMAERIVGERDASGPFESVDDLLRVSGLGHARLERLRARARV